MNSNRLDWSNWSPSEEEAAPESSDSVAADSPGVTLLSPEELLAKLRGLVTTYQDRGRDALNRNPLESLVGLVTAGAAIYYAAERGHNDKVKTYWDALEFVSTCASVGYSDPLPTTTAASAVPSTTGPSDPALLAKLDELLVELRKLNAPNKGS